MQGFDVLGFVLCGFYGVGFVPLGWVNVLCIDWCTIVLFGGLFNNTFMSLVCVVLCECWCLVEGLSFEVGGGVTAGGWRQGFILVWGVWCFVLGFYLVCWLVLHGDMFACVRVGVILAGFRIAWVG